MAAKVFEKSAEETAFRAVLKEVYESGDGADRIHARDVHRPDEPHYKGRKQGHSAP